MAAAEPEPRSNGSAKVKRRKPSPSRGFDALLPDKGDQRPSTRGKRVASVELRGLTKRFGSLVVVDDVSLRVDHGQLVCLLGPSGCGKTTTLRLIAGFLDPSDGEIHVGDRVVSSRARTLPPES